MPAALNPMSSVKKLLVLTVTIVSPGEIEEASVVLFPAPRISKNLSPLDKSTPENKPAAFVTFTPLAETVPFFARTAA